MSVISKIVTMYLLLIQVPRKMDENFKLHLNATDASHFVNVNLFTFGYINWLLVVTITCLFVLVSSKEFPVVSFPWTQSQSTIQCFDAKISYDVTIWSIFNCVQWYSVHIPTKRTTMFRRKIDNVHWHPFNWISFKMMPVFFLLLLPISKYNLYSWFIRRSETRDLFLQITAITLIWLLLRFLRYTDLVKFISIKCYFWHFSYHISNGLFEWRTTGDKWLQHQLQVKLGWASVCDKRWRQNQSFSQRMYYEIGELLK